MHSRSVGPRKLKDGIVEPPSATAACLLGWCLAQCRRVPATAFAGREGEEEEGIEQSDRGDLPCELACAQVEQLNVAVIVARADAPVAVVERPACAGWGIARVIRRPCGEC